MKVRSRFFCAAVIGMMAIIPFKNSNAKSGMTKCEIDFHLGGFSIIYKSSSGSGTITCDNGQTAEVKVKQKAGGVSFGGSSLKGHGTFSKVADIEELYGSYGGAEGHAGIGKSASATTLTKDGVSLNLTATGEGVDIGFDFGSLKISKK